MIFLVSSERSGSNMLRAIMGRHSQISAPPPPHLVKTFVPLLPAYGRLHDEENLRRLIADVLAVIDNQLGKWSSSFAGEQIVRDLPDRSFPALLRYVYEHEARANGKSISFVKDNGNILWLADLQAAVESPRFVYLVRDPRDYALSWSKSVVHAGGVSAAVRVWQREQSLALSTYAMGLNGEQVLLTKYEDLVADPEKELRRICDHVGIEFEADMISRVDDRSQQIEARRIKDWENVASSINRSNFNKFGDGLSRWTVSRIERALGTEMKVLGYELTGPYARPSEFFSLAGKAYRAATGLLRLLVRGRERRDEVAIRVRRLSKMREIQRKVLGAPRSIMQRSRQSDTSQTE